MGLLLLYLSIALCISFLCSVLEAVLLSTSPSYIEQLDRKGVKGGKRFKKLKENIDNPLAAILSLNTIAHTVGATGVGAQAVKIYGEAYVGLISAIVTILILVLSEIIPKSIGAVYWKKLAPTAAGLMSGLIVAMYPLVVLSKFITKLITSKSKEPVTSREEVAALASLGSREGIFEEGESKIINNLIRLKSINVESIMTPRTVMLAVEENLTVLQLFKLKDHLRFSRIPVFRENIDRIEGFVLKNDILNSMANDQPNITLKELMRDIMVVYEKKSVAEFFETLVERREHIALVIDEYGGVSGIATMEDVIETLLGLEIIDESDENVDMQQYAREKWKIRAQKLGLIKAFDDIDGEPSQE